MAVTPSASHTVPQQRIRDKVNEYMSRKDYAGVERTLLYWLREAESSQDDRGRLMVLNELIGHYRKTGEKDKAYRCIQDALALAQRMGYAENISGATTCVNSATAYHAFGEYESALPLFERARVIYENCQGTDPELVGGLYNNLGLTYTALHLYDKAHEVYDLAMLTMARVKNGALEQAITCLNRANALEAEHGMEAAENQIYALMEQAEALLTMPEIPRDGYYAYVCEQSAPTFEYYGFFAAAARLRTLSEAFYERT